MLLIILEKVLEAIYFALFLIYGKDLKEKRVLFICLMVFQYLALKFFIQYNIWFQILYTFITYLDLKFLYKEKAQITDIFLFMASSIFLILVGIICVQFRFATRISYFATLIINRTMLFVLFLLIRNKIRPVYVKFYKKWNRHKDKTKIKSLTLRNISIIVFNLMFYIINIGLTYIILMR